MQLDLCALQNVQSDVTSANRAGAPGRRTADRAQNPSGTGAREKDFRSTLERAESYRETDSQRTGGKDKPVEQTENRSPAGANDKSPRKAQSEQKFVDCDNPQGQPPANEAPVESGTVIPAVQIKTDAVDSIIDTGAGAPVIAAQLPTEMVPEIPAVSKPEAAAGGSTGAASHPTRQVPGAVASVSAVSVAFAGEHTGAATTSTVPVIEDPAGVKSDTTAKPSPLTAEPAVDVAAAATTSDHSEYEVLDKSPSETQKILPQNDPSSKAAENAPETDAKRTSVQQQAGTERQTSENAKKMAPAPPVPENSGAGEGPHRKTVTNERPGQPEIDRGDRLVVEGERRPRSESTSAAQNESRGNHEVSSASAAKTGVDVDQNVKVNDLVPISQRPVVGEGNAPVSAENLESRPSAPKADVLNQIVDRAVFKLNNGQAEVRIDLKPDFLGHVRLQIVTESHQVNLRILAESHAVKDLIDGHLGQLKHDLQAQGLKVDEIDVSVAKDFNDFDRRPKFTAHEGQGRRRSAFNGQGRLEDEIADGSRLSTRLNTRAGGIDCFA